MDSLFTTNNDKLYALGFRFGKRSVHTSRTMMLAELTTLLAASSPSSTKDEYFQRIIDDNFLGKSTLTTRRLTAKRLTDLYSLDSGVCLFRALRHFWFLDEQARPILALIAALARDTLLRVSVEIILSAEHGGQLTSATTAAFLDAAWPDRFSRATITSLAQNINSTWTQAGYLSGKVRKHRIQPVITPTTVTYALFLAYLEGARAQRLFDSFWVRVLDLSKVKIHDLAIAASHRGWLDYRRVGEVIDIRFPDLLTSQEEELLREQT